MKRLAIVAFCCLMTFCVTGQEKTFEFGARVGWNKTKIKVKDHLNGYDADSKGGYMGGIFGRVNLGKFYIEPGVEYVQKRTQIQRSPKDTKLRNYSVDIPVMFGYKFWTFERAQVKLRAFAGPSFSFLTKDMEIYSTHEQTKYVADDMMYYVRAGLGVDIWKANLDICHEFGLKEFGKPIRIPRSWNFSIGFRIF